MSSMFPKLTFSVASAWLLENLSKPIEIGPGAGKSNLAFLFFIFLSTLLFSIREDYKDLCLYIPVAINMVCCCSLILNIS